MVVTIDLRKVFDTVDHQILSNKLQAMGVFNIKWFQSYLTGRKPLVNVDNSKSYLVDISCVYQREAYWAPYIFFIMSISITSDSKHLLYIYDITTMFSNKHLKNSENVCSEQLIDNNLCLHLDKTQCILFVSKRKIKNHS